MAVGENEMMKANMIGSGSDTDCEEKADEFYDAVVATPEGRPLFWRRFGYRKEKFQVIFKFFCEVNEYYQTGSFLNIRNELKARLDGRYSGTELELPTHLAEDINATSDWLLNAFQRLEDEGLTAVAFELFVTGTLTIRPNEHFEKGRFTYVLKNNNLPHRFPEPDGGMFYCWAEFAFLAYRFGFEQNRWKRILPSLLRAGRIFPLCYGQPRHGTIPSDRVFDDYNNIPDSKFNFIHPDDTLKISLLTEAATFEELETEAHACLRFAFPNGVG